MLGIFYVSAWLALVALTIILRIYAIDRTLPGHFSITLVLVLYTVYLLAHTALSRLRGKWPAPLVCWAFVVALTINFVHKNRDNVTHYLCHFPVNFFYDIMAAGVQTIPPGSAVSFSDGGFFWY